MGGHGEKYSRKKHDAIAALLLHPNIGSAAEKVGITTETLILWMKKPDFDQDYKAAKALSYGQAISRLQYASTAAVNTILTIMVDKEASSTLRLRAADMILNHARQGIEIDVIESRIVAIERSMKEGIGLEDAALSDTLDLDLMNIKDLNLYADE